MDLKLEETEFTAPRLRSSEFDDNSLESRPQVQVGDPFMEKLLLESCQELMQDDAIVMIQDMGAAGLTSSSLKWLQRETVE